MRTILLCILAVLTLNTYAEDDHYKVNAILNTCIFKAEIAQGTQIARQTEPQYNKQTSEHKVRFLLKEYDKWYIDKIIDIHNMVWDTYPTELSSTKLFAEVYNECVAITKQKMDVLQAKEEFY